MTKHWRSLFPRVGFRYGFAASWLRVYFVWNRAAAIRTYGWPGHIFMHYRGVRRHWSVSRMRSGAPQFRLIS